MKTLRADSTHKGLDPILLPRVLSTYSNSRAMTFFHVFDDVEAMN